MNSPDYMRLRRSIRLKGYDYTQVGAYFITVCSYGRLNLFGQASSEGVHLNEFGSLVEAEWLKTGAVRSNVDLDEYVIMPNHFHGILIISGTVGEGTARHAPTAPRFGESIPSSLGAIIGSFKSAATRAINRVRRTPGQPIWQRNYYEHIIRDDTSLNRIREYILTNPTRWGLDRENPDRNGTDEFDLWLRQFRRHQGQDVLQAGK